MVVSPLLRAAADVRGVRCVFVVDEADELVLRWGPQEVEEPFAVELARQCRRVLLGQEASLERPDELLMRFAQRDLYLRLSTGGPPGLRNWVVGLVGTNLRSRFVLRTASELCLDHLRRGARPAPLSRSSPAAAPSVPVAVPAGPGAPW